MAASLARSAPIKSLGLDKLGVVVAALLAIGAASPFAVFRPNRIAAGEAKPFLDALPPVAVALLLLAYCRRRRRRIAGGQRLAPGSQPPLALGHRRCDADRYRR